MHSSNNIQSSYKKTQSSQIQNKNEHQSATQLNQEEDVSPLDRINLRQLRDKNRETQNTIKSIQTKIIYMKNKQQKTVKKVLNIKKKLTLIENVRSKTKQIKQKYTQDKKKQQQDRMKKTEFNKLIKDHLKYNKKIVNTLMNHKISQQAKSFKLKNNKLQILTNIQHQNLVEENIQKANKVRMDHIESHERRKMYFLDKLHQFKQLKEDKLKQQMRQRERQEQMIYDLEQKERMLLQRLSLSEKFRVKCQEQYQQARNKYKSFYEVTKGLNRGHHSCDQSRISQYNQGKADIFIS